VILPVAIRRGSDGMFHVGFSPIITVPSASDADVARATQAIADALEATIAAAPNQWYSFKPIWPPTAEEAAELAARAERMLGGPPTASATPTTAAPAGSSTTTGTATHSDPELAPS